MDKIVPVNSPLTELATNEPPPDWVSEELKPYTREDYIRELRALAELEGNE